MPNIHLSADGYAEPLVRMTDELLAKLWNMQPIIEEAVDKVARPILASHYDKSGLKTTSGTLRKAAAVKGAKGNVTQVTQNGATIGVSYAAVPHARWAFEGRGRVVPVRAKVLRWYDESGKPVFSKHSRATKPHPVVFLTASELGEIGAYLATTLVKRGAEAIKKRA